jgi:ribonuclease D
VCRGHSARGARRVARSAAQSSVIEVDRDLFQALLQKRMEMARAQNVPPYVIFHDKTLIEPAAARPASRAEMANVPGVGEAKLDRYGPAFLTLIADITRWRRDDRFLLSRSASPLSAPFRTKWGCPQRNGERREMESNGSSQADAEMPREQYRIRF